MDKTQEKSTTKTTVQISKETMREVKLKAVQLDISYTEYLESIIRKAWENDRNTDKRRKL